MAMDEKLALDEARRRAQHDAVRNTVRNEVQSEVATHANRFDEGDEARLAALGNRMRDKTINEVSETDAEIERARGVARVSQVIDYIFYLIYGIISLEIVLELLGARQSNGFRNLIDALATPLLAPFRNLVPDPAAGRFHFRFSYLIALVVYILLHLAINGLLRLMAHRKTEV
ncbi:MAG TPA: YggT family protein [Blastocatellia bacterium]|nr:YggT family protein [Blastocatellia bacterium]